MKLLLVSNSSLQELPGFGVKKVSDRLVGTFRIPLRLTLAEMREMNSKDASVDLLRKHDEIDREAFSALETAGFKCKTTNYGLWCRKGGLFLQVVPGSMGWVKLLAVDKNTWVSNGRYRRYVSLPRMT